MGPLFFFPPLSYPTDHHPRNFLPFSPSNRFSVNGGAGSVNAEQFGGWRLVTVPAGDRPPIFGMGWLRSAKHQGTVPEGQSP